MPAAEKVPYEIIEIIIDGVWDEPEDFELYSEYTLEYGTLCALARTCKSLLHRSRINLLRNVSLLTMPHLDSFATMLATVPENAPLVKELTILSTMKKPSPAESFAPILAGKLPSVWKLRIRTEHEEVEDLDQRPTISFHPAAIASLTRFESVTHLQLFGLCFIEYSDFLRLIHSLPNLNMLQCMQVWFKQPIRDNTHIEDSYVNRPMKLRIIDVAYFPRLAVKGLLRLTSPQSLQELSYSPNSWYTKEDIVDMFGGLPAFTALDSFTYFVPVSDDGAQYIDVATALSLVHPNVRTITISHYLFGDYRAHVVPKKTLIDAIRENADLIQDSLTTTDTGSDDRFPHTHVVFQFQGFHDSESWWWEQLKPILPRLFARADPAKGGTFAIQNVTYNDWSPWLDDEERSAKR